MKSDIKSAKITKDETHTIIEYETNEPQEKLPITFFDPAGEGKDFTSEMIIDTEKGTTYYKKGGKLINPDGKQSDIESIKITIFKK